eukprot:Amastigsp_a846071_127.p2 type:complete len:263 gc:universal Amastigsp_a846071_127:504-1292(+)
MRVRLALAVERHVAHPPAEQVPCANVDHVDEERRREEATPEDRRREHLPVAEQKIDRLGRAVNKRAQQPRGQPARSCRRRKGDEDIELGLETRIEREPGERLRGALREADVRDAVVAGRRPHRFDERREVLLRVVVEAKVPVRRRPRREARVLARVPIAARVSQPHVKALVRQSECEPVCGRHPCLRVLHQPMLDDDRRARACGCVDASRARNSMHNKNVPVGSDDRVLFACVSKVLDELHCVVVVCRELVRVLDAKPFECG